MIEILEPRKLLSGNTVTITTPDHTVAEGDVITFDIERTGDLTESLTLDVELTGTAIPGQDTMIPNGTVTFDAGESTASYSLIARPDDEVETVEDLTATLRDRVGATTLVQRGEIRVALDDVDSDEEDNPHVRNGPNDPPTANGAINPNATETVIIPGLWQLPWEGNGFLDNLPGGGSRIHLPDGYQLWYMNATGTRWLYWDIPPGSDIIVDVEINDWGPTINIVAILHEPGTMVVSVLPPKEAVPW